jgi:hypothetical protein
MEVERRKLRTKVEGRRWEEMEAEKRRCKRKREV